MEKRILGKTGEKVSILGLGGFHLLEVSDAQVQLLVNTFSLRVSATALFGYTSS